uniref:hypothetical protein n=1 Tax=Peribacillus glennii TaxID=2303991 RepID=UPI002D77744E|nr:hypothetical protein [Peribacillus glennii]
MEKAIVISIIKKNLCQGATIKGKTNDNSLKFIESEDIPALLQEANKYDYIYWLFFKVLIETGLRKGEASALQCGQILT